MLNINVVFQVPARPSVPAVTINCLHVIRTNPFVHRRVNVITVQGNEIDCRVRLRANFVHVMYLQITVHVLMDFGWRT